MPTIEVTNACTDYETYRASRVKSMFNVAAGHEVEIRAEIPIDDLDWNIGVVVGPSGSGKTTIGHHLIEGVTPIRPDLGWPKDKPIIDAIDPKGEFDTVTAALSAVGLGDVPAWLRPFSVLSMGEQFRAALARLVATAGPDSTVIVDEFTSVVDRQIAQVGAAAFAKAWRRSGGRAVLLSCHYDILEWLEPDWIYDTRDRAFRRERLRRPKLELEVVQTDHRWWELFRPHHYLSVGPMPFSKAVVGFIGDEPVAHLGVSSHNLQGRPPEYRACRMVIMPEWQGAGVGTRFLNHVCAENLAGRGHLGYPATTIFHTSHPGLIQYLRRAPLWRQVSHVLGGDDRRASAQRLAKSRPTQAASLGYGGHFRAVQGFRYVGDRTDA